MLTELPSDDSSRPILGPILSGWPLPDITVGYRLRAALIARDGDFRPFAAHCGLKLS